jgi:thymidylate synthase
MTRYRNAEQAFADLLRAVIESGDEVTVRESKTLEIRSQLIEIERPWERVVAVPGRNNNIFASIAESLWVLSGRDDVAFLQGYLKRAMDFSDDGSTWRGAYGPRLRNWRGTDQLANIVELLNVDPESRRAVAMLFDPARDMVESKDIPCNNWLHFMRREGRLHLNVVARSTDIWWGLSGINLFEWALLLEMMAHWVGDEPGEFSFFTSSLHLYERHYARAATVLGAASTTSTYRAGSMHRAFATPFVEFDRVLDKWMTLEQHLRDGANLSELHVPFADPLLEQYIQMIDIYWAHRRGIQPSELSDRIALIGDSDLRHAATEFIERPNSRNH